MLKFSIGTVFVIMGSIFFGVGAVIITVGITLFFDISSDNVDKLLLLGCGALFMILGAAFLLSVILKAVRKKRLIANGDQLTGTIVAVNLNMSVTVNGYHPYRADCEVFDPNSGERYLYRSENTMEDISGLVGMSVTVYADPNNRKKYYVDVVSLADSYRSENQIHDYR